MKQALGVLEVVGKAAAVGAVDAACKTADVYLLGIENIIGSGGVVGVNIQIAGEVAAVQAAVDAARDSVNRFGTVLYSAVIPRPNDEIDKLLTKLQENLKPTSLENSEEQKENIKEIETTK